MNDGDTRERPHVHSGSRHRILGAILPLVLLLGRGGNSVFAGGSQVELLGITPEGTAQQRLQHDPVERLSRPAPGIPARTGIVDVWSRLNVRAGPGMQYPIIGKLYPGQPIQILATQGDWYRIDWNGREGWCCAYWVHTAGTAWHNAELAISLNDSGARSLAGKPSYGGAGPFTGPPIGGDGTGTGPDATALTPATGGSLLGMPLIDQNTGGGSRPGAYCGPTSVRMVLAYYGIQAGADQVALGRYGPGTPMYVPGEGATHSGMAAVLRHFGLQAEVQYGKSLSHLREATAAGHPVIIGVSGNYAGFYVPGHILVVVGVDSQGNVLVNDPAGGKRRVIPPAVMMNVWSGLFLEVWR